MFLLIIAPPVPRVSMVLNCMVEAESHVMSSWEEEKPNTKKAVCLQVKNDLEVPHITEVGPN